jgi:hypothetical protein
MSRITVIEVYAGVGVLTAVWVALRQDGWAMRLAAVPLWPFLLPALLGARDDSHPQPAVENAALNELARRVAESWAQGPAPSVEGARERQVIDGFIARLRGVTQRIAEIEAAREHAPARAQEPLRKMAESSRADLAAGVTLLEELLAQLVLLRFAELPAAGARTDRARIEELLARIEEVVNLQAGAATSP